MSDLSLRPAAADDRSMLLALFREADESEEKVLAVLEDPAHSLAVARRGSQVIGAAVTAWECPQPEILYLAVGEAHRGQGYGRHLLELLSDEGRRRELNSLWVGTASTDFGNLAFYQKCGFRMSYIRPNYFAYVQPPLIENGIPMLDMVVFRKRLF